MAIFHLSMKAVSRSAGRSGTASAAYRSGEKITDERTGEIHDYTRKGGVESAELVMPEGVPSMSRSDLWNGVELHHKRGDAVVAREFEVALPAELPAAERHRLAVDFAREVANHYGVAADVCIHAPGKEGDDRNHHAHILFTACTIGPDGFGKKAAELDPIHCQRHKIANPAEVWRECWAKVTNERLAEHQSAARIDHRTLEAQGIDREPTAHLGPTVASMERRGKETEVGKRMIAANRFSKKQPQERKHGQAQRKRNFDRSGNIQRWKNGARAVTQGTPPQSINNLRSLSRVGVVRFAQRSEVLLPDNALGQLEHLRAEPDNALRRDDAGDSRRIAEQLKAFEIAQKKLAAQRIKRIESIEERAIKRQERREKVARRTLQAAPGKPTGIMAAFKNDAYKEAINAWEKATGQARKIVEQAKKLCSRLNEAAQQHKAMSWAYKKIKEKDPALVQRIEAHRKEQSPLLQREQKKTEHLKR